VQRLALSSEHKSAKSVVPFWEKTVHVKVQG
jgi:hypothetical protein